MADYSVRRVTTDLVDEIKQALKSVKGWGSVEIYVQDHRVTQLTTRNIKKTNHLLSRTKKS
jgi:hypothetical protein